MSLNVADASAAIVCYESIVSLERSGHSIGTELWTERRAGRFPMKTKGRSPATPGVSCSSATVRAVAEIDAHTPVRTTCLARPEQIHCKSEFPQVSVI